MVRKVKSAESPSASMRELGLKKSVQLSSVSQLRWKEPTSQRVRANMQFVHDYSQFQQHTPDMRKGILVEASSGPCKGKAKSSNKQSINPSSNRSSIFGPTRTAFLGSAGDNKGNY